MKSDDKCYFLSNYGKIKGTENLKKIKEQLMKKLNRKSLSSHRVWCDGKQRTTERAKRKSLKKSKKRSKRKSLKRSKRKSLKRSKRKSLKKSKKRSKRKSLKKSKKRS